MQSDPRFPIASTMVLSNGWNDKLSVESLIPVCPRYKGKRKKKRDLEKIKAGCEVCEIATYDASVHICVRLYLCVCIIVECHIRSFE